MRIKIKYTRKINTSIIHLEKNVDILKHVSNHNSLRPKLVIGFAAETNNLKENSKNVPYKEIPKYFHHLLESKRSKILAKFQQFLYFSSSWKNLPEMAPNGAGSCFFLLSLPTFCDTDFDFDNFYF